MKPNNFRTTMLLIIIAAASTLKAQHGHLDAGATSHAQDSQLIWANGAAFAAGSGFVKQLDYTNSGRFAGHFQGSITLTALESTNGGSALGSFLQAQIVSVAGPAGGAFEFWDSTDLGGSLVPTFVIPVGTTGGSFQFALSDASAGAGLPAQDAYGHLHGRRFSTTTAGDYTVGFRVVDTSNNGMGGGPIHAASDVLFINFTAVPEPSIFALTAIGAGALLLLRRRRR